jgi:hypothetical protein
MLLDGQAPKCGDNGTDRGKAIVLIEAVYCCEASGGEASAFILVASLREDVADPCGRGLPSRRFRFPLLLPFGRPYMGEAGCLPSGDSLVDLRFKV